MNGRELFRTVATGASGAVGSPWAFLVAVVVCLVWAASGPYYHYSDTWQLVINTGTTVLTFLIVFLIQYSQNRDSKAIQLKLDELLRGVKGARTGLVDLEQRSDDELRQLKEEFAHIREEQGEAIKVVEEMADEAKAGRRPLGPGDSRAKA
jgi:low affinity Fe/Cu permease